MRDSRPLSKYDDPEIELFVQSGRTISEIAEIYGFDIYDVEQYLRRRRPGLYQQAVENQEAKAQARGQSIPPPAVTPPVHTPPP
ncbi:MAG: hypothetical protein HOP33_03470 [Verrucomicrobia bacterium]|nr:hypothetical protein [Verrucomicrobiota bacterium]